MPKTMEDVWKDITLSSDLHVHPQSSSRDHALNTTTFSNIILQDFFPQPFGANNYQKPVPAGHFISPAPKTLLTLTSGPDDHFGSFGNSSSQQILSSNSDSQPDAGAGVNVQEKKRYRNVVGDSSDRRQKRMIKNRESAARSRARKQAYTDALEIEVDNLMKENMRLKQQQKQLSLAAAAHQVLKKPTLHRTSTAPF